MHEKFIVSYYTVQLVAFQDVTTLKNHQFHTNSDKMLLNTSNKEPPTHFCQLHRAQFILLLLNAGWLTESLWFILNWNYRRMPNSIALCYILIAASTCCHRQIRIQRQLHVWSESQTKLKLLYVCKRNISYISTVYLSIYLHLVCYIYDHVFLRLLGLLSREV